MSIPIPVRNLIAYLRDEVRRAIAIAEFKQLTVQLQEMCIEMACASADGLPIADVLELGDFAIGDDDIVSPAALELLDRFILVDMDSLATAATGTVCRLVLRFVP